MITVTDLIDDPEIYHDRTQRPLGYGPVHLGPVLSPEMTLNDQLRRATLANAAEHSSVGHDSMELWTWAAECGHVSPDDDPRFEGLDDLIDEALKPIALTSRDGDPYYVRVAQAKAGIPLYVDYENALDAYDVVHGGGVCRDQPMGACCLGCTEGSEDFGYEPGGCSRQANAVEAYSDFWYANGNTDIRPTVEAAAA